MAAPLQIGRYVLYGEIASGGMATVHYGRLVDACGFAKIVAIKRLHRVLARDGAFRKMILEEARLAARVRHPNVVPPLDVLAEGGELLLVMEYVHGESLSRLLRSASKSSERVPLAVGAAILANVLHGLHAAHEARDEAGKPLDIVHRDVSPQNVIVGADGVARVIDFGIAKAVTSEQMTTAGTIKGKVPYLAPEQLEGDPATRRTDLYAASVVFWEVLAGRHLFEGSDDAEVLRNILTTKVEPPSKWNPLVPGSLDDVVLRGLSRDPQARFASAREMALALEEAIHLATASAVGSWTERLAAETLAARAAAIVAVEASTPASDELDPAPTKVQPLKVPRPSPTGLPRVDGSTRAPPSSMRASTPPMRPPPAWHPVIEPRTVICEPPPQPEPAFVQGVRAITRTLDASSPPVAPASAGAARSRAVGIGNAHLGARRRPQTTKAGSAFKRFCVYLAAFFGVALIVAYMFAPALVRAWVVTGAAARGMTVTIERVDVSRRAIRLSDVKGESSDLPGVAMRAGTIVINLRWLTPDSITVDDAELALDGPYGEISASYDAYREKHLGLVAESFAGIRRIDVASGRIDWKRIFGAGTSALAENVTVDVGQIGIRPLGKDYRVAAPLFTIQLAGKVAGPWQLDLDRQGILARAVVHFDPSGSFPAQVTRTAADDGSVSLSIHVPPTSLRDLHLPAAVLGGLASEQTRLEVHGEVSIVAQEEATKRSGGASEIGAVGSDGGVQPAATTMTRSVSGHVVFAAGSLSVFPTGPLVDLSLALPLNGDAARPIAIAGVLAVAPADPRGGASTAIATAVTAGTLDVSGRAVRVVMAGRTGAIPCARGRGPAFRGEGQPGPAFRGEGQPGPAFRGEGQPGPAFRGEGQPGPAFRGEGQPGPAFRGEGQPGPAAGPNGLHASIVGVLDDYPGAKVSFLPVSTCVPRLH